MRALLVKDVTVSLAISSQSDTTTILSSVAGYAIDISQCLQQQS